MEENTNNKTRFLTYGNHNLFHDIKSINNTIRHIRYTMIVLDNVGYGYDIR